MMTQEEIEILDLQDLDSNLIPECVFCQGRLFSQFCVIGRCGHIYHEKCAQQILESTNEQGLICPIDRKKITKDSSFRIYGHDIAALMRNASFVIKKYKTAADKNKLELDTQNDEIKKINRKLEKKKRKLEEVQKERAKYKGDLDNYKEKFDSILREKNKKMKQIEEVETDYKQNKVEQEQEKQRNKEILDEKNEIIEQFETDVDKLQTKIETEEKYRPRDSFPTVSGIVTKYHKEQQKEIDSEKKKFMNNKSDERFSEDTKLVSMKPYVELDTMLIYQGQILESSDGVNIKYGWGRALFCNGTYYEGVWCNDKKDGFGVEIKPSGSYKIGFWKADKLHGKAKYVNLNGCVYEGDWQNGRKHGKGSEVYIDNDGKSTYLGTFKNDKKHGKGVYNCSAYEYRGEFKDGQVTGEGKMTWTGGKKVYTGQWLNGKRHGKGLYEKKGQFTLEADYYLNNANGNGTVKFEGKFIIYNFQVVFTTQEV